MPWLVTEVEKKWFLRGKHITISEAHDFGIPLADIPAEVVLKWVA